MYKIPQILSYPIIPTISDCPEIIGQFCYIIEPYKPGIAVVVKIDGDEQGTAFGDWNGVSIGPSIPIWPVAAKFLADYNIAVGQLARQIKIQQFELFIAEDGRLIDVQLEINRFVGPGMLRDLFNKIMPTQVITEIAVVDESKIKVLKSCVLKPSRIKMSSRNAPLYACI